MWLITGLGNPGPDYETHRHNIGFHAADAIADSLNASTFRSKFQGSMAEARCDEEKILILKPETYMNESGRSVQEAANFFKIPAERILVIHDELDLETGRMRIKFGGGHAGHNGLRSISRHLGTDDYWRIRIGIGHPGDKNKVHGYVLAPFSREEKTIAEKAVQAVADHIALFLQGRPELFQTRATEAARG